METWTLFTYILPGYHITLYHVSGSQGRPRLPQLDFWSALSNAIYRVVFLTGPPDFQYQNEKQVAANQD